LQRMQQVGLNVCNKNGPFSSLWKHKASGVMRELLLHIYKYSGDEQT
jgi:hypothetical protein